jgi:hypothetical protein
VICFVPLNIDHKLESRQLFEVLLPRPCAATNPEDVVQDALWIPRLTQPLSHGPTIFRTWGSFINRRHAIGSTAEQFVLLRSCLGDVLSKTQWRGHPGHVGENNQPFEIVEKNR